jgi:hypothetical protein
MCMFMYYIFIHSLYAYVSIMNANRYVEYYVFMHLSHTYVYVSVMNASMHIRVLCIHAFTIYVCTRYEC